MSKKRFDRHYVTALDLGTSKITVLVGEINAHQEIEIVACGQSHSKGLRHGTITNIEAIKRGIQQAVERAELTINQPIESITASIGSTQLRGSNSNGTLPLRTREVTQADVAQVVDNACAIHIPADQRILHVLPQEYRVDNTSGIQEPVGMSGIRLDVDIHIVTVENNVAQNVEKCIQGCKLELDRLVLRSLASAEAVLSDSDKEMGVCLVDIGASVCDVAIFYQGTVRHTAVLRIGGDQVTNDVGIGLHAMYEDAEKIKLQYGAAVHSSYEQNETYFDVPTIGNAPKKLSQQVLIGFIKPRMEELFDFLYKEILRSGLEKRLGAGIVLTGGAAQLIGITELAEQVFGLPVRLGQPRGVHWKVPVQNAMPYSTAVGLLKLTQKNLHKKNSSAENAPMQHFWERARSWLRGQF